MSDVGHGGGILTVWSMKKGFRSLRPSAEIGSRVAEGGEKRERGSYNYIVSGALMDWNLPLCAERTLLAGAHSLMNSARRTPVTLTFFWNWRTNDPHTRQIHSS